MKTLAARNTVAASIALGLVAISAFTTTSVLAAGASAQAPVTPTVLEARWDGHQGIQQTAAGGVLAQWNASHLGEVVTQNYTPSGWGAPAELSVQKANTGLPLAQRQAKAANSYRPAAWGAPAELALTDTGSNTATLAMTSTSNSALKMHR